MLHGCSVYTWGPCREESLRDKERVNVHRPQFVESQKDKLKEQRRACQAVTLVAMSKLLREGCTRTLSSDWMSERISRSMTCSSKATLVDGAGRRTRRITTTR